MRGEQESESVSTEDDRNATHHLGTARQVVALQKTQQIIVLVGVFLFFLMSAFPPWVYVDDHKVEHPLGYAPIWEPPNEVHLETVEAFGIRLQMHLQRHATNTIDLLRLFMQIAGLALVTGSAVVLTKRAPAIMKGTRRTSH